MADDPDDYAMRLVSARCPEIADQVMPSSVLAQVLDLIAVVTERLAGLQALVEPTSGAVEAQNGAGGHEVANGPEWRLEARWADAVSAQSA
jgi:hypothetical protein